MKVLGLDGKVYALNLVGNNISTNPSNLHSKVREILKEIYPLDRILEEVSLPSTDLRCDFFIPSQKMIIEVNGEQHYKFTKFFHGDKLGFVRAKKRDIEKIKWCQINNIRLVELKYDESDRWREIICGY